MANGSSFSPISRPGSRSGRSSTGYFEIVASGTATCTPAGRDHAFGYNAGSRTLSVGLPAGATATPGIKTGTITIDNLDLTHQGSGTGSLDGNDVIAVIVHVGISCSDPFADADGDGDVDQSDFAVLQLCYSVDTAFSADCACFDRDANGIVDILDFNSFQVCFSGAGVPADPSCDD
jgi:hypothetical protein